MQVPPRIRDVDPGSISLRWEIALLGAVLLLLTARLIEAFGAPVPLCPWRNYTTLPCPFCGGTRSVIALSHGDIAAAFLFNPIGVLIPCGLIGLAVWSLVRKQRAAILLRFRHDWVWTLLAINWVFVIALELASR